eukprot:7888629-Karenia_brevis.AAC.1
MLMGAPTLHFGCSRMHSHTSALLPNSAHECANSVMYYHTQRETAYARRVSQHAMRMKLIRVLVISQPITFSHHNQVLF